MKQICLQCGRTSSGGDLFCQETDCPGERSPTILGAGDWFGDIEIIKPVVVLRSAGAVRGAAPEAEGLFEGGASGRRAQGAAQA